MADIKGQNVSGTLRPNSTEDKYPVTLSEENKGGAKQFASLAEYFQKVPIERRAIGEWVYVQDTDSNYQFKNGIEEANLEFQYKGNLKNILDEKLSYTEYTNGSVYKGVYNISTNIPQLTENPNVAFNDGDYYEIDSPGIIAFSGGNFLSGTEANTGDKLKKKGLQWELIRANSVQFGKSFTLALQSEVDRPLSEIIQAGTQIDGTTNDTIYNWKFNELGFSSINGTIKQVFLWANGAGNIPLDVIAVSDGTATLVKTLGTFSVENGFNAIDINQSIIAGQFVAFGKSATGAAGIRFKSSGLVGNRFVQANSQGTELTYGNAGSYYSLGFSVEHTIEKPLDSFRKKSDSYSKSETYNKSETYTKNESDTKYLESGSKFTLALQSEVDRPSTNIVQAGTQIDGTGNDTIYNWKFNELGFSSINGTIKQVFLWANGAGNIPLDVIAVSDGTATLVKTLGTFSVVNGYNTIDINESIVSGQFVAFGKSATGAAGIRFKSSGLVGNRFVQSNSQGTELTYGNAGSYYSLGFSVEHTIEKPLDKYITDKTFVNAIENYATDERLGAEILKGVGTNYDAILGIVSTEEFFAINTFANADGYITEIQINAETAGTINFGVGIIDQNDYVVIRKQFSKTCVVGLNVFTIQEDILENETLFIKTPTINLRQKSSAGYTYYRSIAAGYGSKLSLITGNYIAFIWKFKEILSPVFVTPSQLSDVENKIQLIDPKKPIIAYSPSGYPYQIKVSDAGVISASAYSFANMLVLGNSITKHPIVSNVWWGVWGMAASVREKDFVNVLAGKLAPKVPSFTFSAENISAWEANHTTYNYELLDSYFIQSRDLVVIRLGENVQINNLTNFQNSYQNLIDHIKTKAPNAKIVCTGVFWTNETKDTAIQAAANVKNVSYVKLSQLDVSENKSAIGAMVYGDDNAWHEVTNAGVAAHPGDTGMQRIADAIFNSLGL